MVKIKAYVNLERNNKWANENDDIVINSSEEAKICLNCPFSKCPKNGTCEYYQEKIKEIKNEKSKKQ